MAQEVVVLKPRGTGKGAARACRKNNLVPAIIYGKSIEPVAVALDAPAVKKVLGRIGIRIHHVTVENSDFEGDVMVQDAVYDPISRKPLHFDLHKISLTEKVRTEIPVVVTGGDILEKNGFILQRQLRHISIECMPTEIPNNVTVSVAGLGHGGSVTAGEVTLPDNVRLITSPGEVLVAAVTPKAVEEKAVEKPVEGAAPVAEAKPEKPESPKS